MRQVMCASPFSFDKFSLKLIENTKKHSRVLRYRPIMFLDKKKIKNNYDWVPNHCALVHSYINVNIAEAYGTVSNKTCINGIKVCN
jgi:hypothetical protein